MFGLSQAYTLQALEEKRENGTLDSAVLPCDILFRDLPALTLDAEGEARIRRAAQRIRKETGADIDYGFRVLRVE